MADQFVTRVPFITGQPVNAHTAGSRRSAFREILKRALKTLHVQNVDERTLIPVPYVDDTGRPR